MNFFGRIEFEEVIFTYFSCGASLGSASSGSASSGGGQTIRRRKTCISARERNLRRLESNERERMRMHSLNDAFEVNTFKDTRWIIEFSYFSYCVAT